MTAGSADEKGTRDLAFDPDEAADTLAAIRDGDVDAIVVTADGRPQVFVLKGADHAHRILLESLNEGAMTIGPGAIILYANRRLAELVGQPLDKVLGASLRGFVAERDLPSFEALVARSAHGRSKGELTLATASGEVAVMASMSAIDEVQPGAFTVVLTDLTALAAAHAALQRAHHELEARVTARTGELSRANEILRDEIAARARLEGELRDKASELILADRRKDEFLSMLAHELRNPLAPIVTAAEMIRLVVPAHPMLDRYRAIIDRQARNLARIVDDLLDVSRITRGTTPLRREIVGLDAVVHSAVEAARPLLEASGHELAVELPEAAVPLDVDRTRMEQVLANLLNNAAKYTERGGHIRLEATVAGGEAHIRVRDDGIGIAEELLPRVFDLFVQGERALDRAQGGLGIGLTMVKSLVEMHGGRVEAHSEGLHRGAEMLVCLPLPPPAVAAVEAPPSAERAPEPAGRRLLVIEDNPDAAHMLCELLTLWGHDVCHARNGEEGLRLAATVMPEIALVDIGLPRMDGYEVARRLRQGAGAKITLISLTGYGQERDCERARAAGFDHQLVKPPEPQALRDLLRRAA
jgi:PAS domain S-box-containing protein